MVDREYLIRTVARAAQIKAQIKAYEDEYNTLLDSLGELEVRDYTAGDYILHVTPNRRFNEAEAKRNLSAVKFKSILKAKPDSALAKALLTPEDYAKCQKDYGVKREIKRVEDME